jgi:hypothetical protein
MTIFPQCIQPRERRQNQRLVCVGNWGRGIVPRSLSPRSPLVCFLGAAICGFRRYRLYPQLNAFAAYAAFEKGSAGIMKIPAVRSLWPGSAVLRNLKLS